jgi:hypothetical protein
MKKRIDLKREREREREREIQGGIFLSCLRIKEFLNFYIENAGI